MGQSISSCVQSLLNHVPICRTRDHRILILGLEGVGKTSLLYFLKLGEPVERTIPTGGFNVETIERQSTEFVVWDIVGRPKMRPLWAHYYEGADGIIFVVNSNDEDTIDEVATVLHDVLKVEELRHCKLLVCANYQDLPNCMSEAKVRERLRLDSVATHPWLLQSTVANTGKGVSEGFEWLCKAITTRD